MAAARDMEAARRVGANAVVVVSYYEGIEGHDIQGRMMPQNSRRIASLLPASYEKMAEMVEKRMAAQEAALVHAHLLVDEPRQRGASDDEAALNALVAASRALREKARRKRWSADGVTGATRPYETLGLDASASQGEILRAYR